MGNKETKSLDFEEILEAAESQGGMQGKSYHHKKIKS